MAYQIIMGPKAAKWFIIMLRGLYPIFDTLPVFSEFTVLSILEQGKTFIDSYVKMTINANCIEKMESTLYFVSKC